MKKIFLFVAIAALGLTSCSSDDNSSNSNNPSVIQGNVQSGTWKITNFNDSGNDETYHFNGFSFTFHSSGVLTATNGTVTHNGNWSITNDSSNDDDNSNGSSDIDFNIYFAPTIPHFEELTEDWDIISQSTTKIQLRHVSGGDGSVDNLTFEKN